MLLRDEELNCLYVVSGFAGIKLIIDIFPFFSQTLIAGNAAGLFVFLSLNLSDSKIGMWMFYFR